MTTLKQWGGSEGFCNGFQMYYSQFGFGYLFHMTTGLVERMLGGGLLVNKNAKSIVQYFYYGGDYTRSKYLPGYVLDYKSEDKEYDFKNLSIISNDLLALANLQRILFASKGRVGSVEREENLKKYLEKFIANFREDYFQIIFFKQDL